MRIRKPALSFYFCPIGVVDSSFETIVWPVSSLPVSNSDTVVLVSQPLNYLGRSPPDQYSSSPNYCTLWDTQA